MSNAKLLRRISIKSPCSANWEEMTGNDRVRFCEHCSLHVQDLSQMTRARAVKLVRKSRGRLCLRVQFDPTGDVVTRHAPQKLYNLSRRASRVAAGAFTAVLSLSTAAYAQSTATPNSNEQGSVAQEPARPKAAGTHAWLTGTVSDPHGEPIPRAAVTVINEQTHETQVTETNDVGEYRVWVSGDYTYTIRASLRGFQDSSTEHVALRLAPETRRDLALHLGGMMGDVAVAITYQQPLVRAAHYADLATVNRLLRSGENVNQAEDDGTTALEVAVADGNIELVRRLLRAGADPNAPNEAGDSVLFWLDDDSDVKLVALLVKAGAKINQANNEGDTVLIHAAEWDDDDLIKALIDAGAQVNEQNRAGNTALMIAAQEGNADTARALLAAGAIYGLRNVEDKDALQLAQENDFDEICDLLKAAGAIAVAK